MILPLILFLFFIGESIFVDLVGGQVFGSDRIFVPHFVLMLLILIGIFYDEKQAIYQGIIFGFLFDIYYTDVIGIHMFMYGFIAYMMGIAKRMLHSNLFITLLLAILSITLLETFSYGVYSLVGKSDMTWESFANFRLLPTLVLNTVYVIISYYPMHKLLFRMKKINKEVV
ncbi:rod shape-determining protein MreD [Bacillus solimangrovi]|uniref:rod shape-determining protein MreD n=1 Tax=Bacillus solimangrovi TaxID=1305675 RepID=UPI001FE155EF|nr:rod shape-determining protein MreD [Bacillus solimangrovi]